MIDAGWPPEEDRPSPVQAVKFRGTIRGGPIPYMTLGLSAHPLHQIRQELLLLAPPDFGDRNIPALLLSLAEEALQSKRPFLRGEVIGPRDEIFDGFPFTAFYATNPVYFPDDFLNLRTESGNSIVIAWLIPITDSEVQFVREHGWSKFEDLLEQHNPNLTDFSRSSLA